MAKQKSEVPKVQKRDTSSTQQLSPSSKDIPVSKMPPQMVAQQQLLGYVEGSAMMERGAALQRMADRSLEKSSTPVNDAKVKTYQGNISKSNQSVVQRSISRGKGWGFFGWADDKAEQLWNDLKKLYETALPKMSKKLAKKAKNFPLHTDGFSTKVEEINNITSEDIIVSHKDASAKKTDWEQLITDGKSLIETLDKKIESDEKELEGLNGILSEAVKIQVKMYEVKPDSHRKNLFPNLSDDMKIRKALVEEFKALTAGKFEDATLKKVKKQVDELKSLFDIRKLRLSLRYEAKAKEDSKEGIQNLQKNLIKLVGKNGVTDTQLEILLPIYRAKKLEQILNFAKPTTLIDYINKEKLNAGYLFDLYIAMNMANKDSDVKDLLNNLDEVSDAKVKLLAKATKKSAGNKENKLVDMLKHPAPIKIIEHMLRQGSIDAVYKLLVTKNLDLQKVKTCLNSNTGKQTVPLLVIQPDADFLIKFDKLGFSRIDMLRQMQVLKLNGVQKNTFVNNVNDDTINDKKSAEKHLGLVDQNEKNHWPMKPIASCTSGLETTNVTAAYNHIVNGNGPPNYVGHGENPKWGVTYYNSVRDDSNLLPGIPGVHTYREYTVQKPLDTGGEGKRRILVRGGKYYYTKDHYRTFTRIR